MGVAVSGLFRAIEKMALRRDAKKRYFCDSVYDVVRGAIIYGALKGMLEGLKMLYSHPRWRSCRLKNRFKPPGMATESGGWRDAIVNGFMAIDRNRHICEVQFHLECLVDIRRKNGGHYMYGIFRSLTEALAVTGNEE